MSAPTPTPGTDGTTTPVDVADGLPDGVTLDGLSPDTTINTTATTPVPSGETVTIPRAVWEQLQRDVAALKASQGAPTTAAVEAPEAAPEAANANRNYLALPDINFVM